MPTELYEPLCGGTFRESFLMETEHLDWPDRCAYTVWSTENEMCYRIVMYNVLEYHFLRTGTGLLGGGFEELLLSNIYVTYDEEYQYWVERIEAHESQGLDSGEPPVCIELAAHIFANRKRQYLTRDRQTGLLVVCRNVDVEPVLGYAGPRPVAHNIPSTD